MLLAESLTLAEAAQALRALDAALAQPGNGSFVVDASALRSFDSAALALLLQARRQAEAKGRGFEVQGAPAPLVQLAQLYGVDQLLRLQPPLA